MAISKEGIMSAADVPLAISSWPLYQIFKDKFNVRRLKSNQVASCIGDIWNNFNVDVVESSGISDTR